MLKKYKYYVSLNKDELKLILKEKGDKEHLHIKNKNNNATIILPKYFYKNFPLYGQILFFARITNSNNGSIITGKFDVPPFFYRLLSFIFALFSLLFLLSVEKEKILYFIIAITIMGICGFILIKIYVLLCYLIFSRENKVVLEFVNSIAEEYPSDNSKNN